MSASAPRKSAPSDRQRPPPDGGYDGRLMSGRSFALAQQAQQGNGQRSAVRVGVSTSESGPCVVIGGVEEEIDLVEVVSEFGGAAGHGFGVSAAAARRALPGAEQLRASADGQTEYENAHRLAELDPILLNTDPFTLGKWAEFARTAIPPVAEGARRPQAWAQHDTGISRDEQVRPKLASCYAPAPAGSARRGRCAWV